MSEKTRTEQMLFRNQALLTWKRKRNPTKHIQTLRHQAHDGLPGLGSQASNTCLKERAERMSQVLLQAGDLRLQVRGVTQLCLRRPRAPKFAYQPVEPRDLGAI